MTRHIRTFKGPLSGVAILAGQVLYAAHQRDMPGLPNQDPSGVFGSPRSPRLRIALLGDSSITAPGVTPLDAAWPRRIAEHLTDRFQVEILSFAVGGAKARDVLAVQLEPAVDSGADLAVLSVGANDALRGTPVHRFEHEISEILERLGQVTDGVGLSGVGDLGTVPRLPSLARGVGRVRGRAIDHALVRAADGFPFVVKGMAWGPLWRIFNDGDPAVVFAADRFHASAVGHACFAAALEPVVEELIRRRDAQPQRSIS
jgi:lysophospholipase L1-like esterase